jgi:hypothetical protein
MEGCSFAGVGCLFMALFAALFTGGIALVVVLLVTQGRRRTETFQAITSKYRGAVSSDFWSGSRIDLDVDGVPSEVSFHSGSKHSLPRTRIRFHWRPPGVLRLSPEGLFTGLQKAFGAQDLQTGDPEFDRRFVVQGSPEAWVRQTLDDGTRRHLIGISELGGGNRTSGLEAGPSGLLITRYLNLSLDRDLLDAFIGKSFEVFRRLRSPAPEEIQVFTTEELVARGECPLCGRPIGASPHRCKQCATPHHAECWDYFGGCATSGCARQGGKLKT